MSKTPTFETDVYHLEMQVQDRFDPIRMFAPESEKETGVYVQAIMSAANKLIRGAGIVSSPDDRVRMTATFSRVFDRKTANPVKIYQELIHCKAGHAEKKSVSLSLLHTVLRLHGNVNTANGLGDVLPRELYKAFVVPHHTTAGWVMVKCINLGSRRNPSWIIDVDSLDHFAYDYKPGSVVMTVVP